MGGYAVQFGAGNIGRGFLGQLYYETGYDTTFVDVIDPVIAALNARRQYPLRIVDNDSSHDMTIERVSAIHASDIAAVAGALAKADIAATAVGVPVLPKVAPAIAKGIEARFETPDAAPLNFIVCENMIGAGPFLREKVRECLGPQWHAVLDEKVGFVEASIGRMVPFMTPEQHAEDLLLICVEPYCELPVDKNGFKGAIPTLKNLQPRDNFGGYVERKLFVHNAGHATTAYLGYLRGHEYIYQAIADPLVRAKADAAMAETCAGLVEKHGLDAAALEAHWHDLVHRFGNRGLGDQVARVAKDPIRKLGPNDRLIGSGLMCLEQGVDPRNLAFATAAAIHYDHPQDSAAARVQEIRKRDGIRGVLTEISQLPGESPLVELVCEAAARLKSEGWIG